MATVPSVFDPANPNDHSLVATIKLDVPIVRGEQTVDTIGIRKPAPGSLRGLRLIDVVQVDVDAMMTLLPRITQPVILEHEVAAMDLSDFIAIANEVANFLPQRGASTGSPSA